MSEEALITLAREARVLTHEVEQRIAAQQLGELFEGLEDRTRTEHQSLDRGPR